jgi:hypothetical protein
VEFHSEVARCDPACPRRTHKTTQPGMNHCNKQQIAPRSRIISVPSWHSPHFPSKTRNQLQVFDEPFTSTGWPG